jgi:dethiobiotin synthetase
LTQRGGALFVTGTDTGVGKTLVACALVRRLRALGHDVGVMKPVETGVGPAGPADGIALRAATGDADPLEDVCPQRFALPAAPIVAAAAEGRSVDLAVIRAAFERVKLRHDWVIAEGAGGLLVPVTEALSMAELASWLELPLLLVARARLGTLNHTRLTLEAARARGLEVAGVVISRGDAALSDPDARNLARLRSELGELWVGELPFLAPGAAAPDDAIDVARLASRVRG